MPKAERPPEHSSILIVGDTGTHKTFLASLFPQCYVFDFDMGMAITRGMVKSKVLAKQPEYDTFRDWDRVKSITQSVPKFLVESGVYLYGQAWPAFTKRSNEIELQIDKGTCPFKSIVYDSLTTMGFSAMANILTVSGHADPHIGSWGSQQDYLRKVIMNSHVWPVYKVYLAHIERKENDLTKITEKLPLVTGKLAGAIGDLMDEVWYAEWEGEGDKRKYFLMTEPKPDRRQAKTRCGVPNHTEMTWQALAPYLVTGYVAPAKSPAILSLPSVARSS